jgi:uncharacterized membrane protein HdeD (DUF308 family)
MSTDSNSPAVLGADVRHELHEVRDHWWAFLVLGIALVVTGTLCIGHPLMASVASVVFLGFLILGSGIAQIVSSFWAGKWSGMLMHLLVGALYAIVGFMIIDAPAENTLLLTKLLALFLIVVGVLDIVSALVQRFHGWGWVLLNGGVTLILGLLINRQWPSSAVWVIGLFVGIEMIFNGWGWIMLAIGLKTSGKKA